MIGCAANAQHPSRCHLVKGRSRLSIVSASLGIAQDAANHSLRSSLVSSENVYYISLMKKSILDPGSRSNVLTRLSGFHADAPALWGKMTAAQCMCHLADQLRIALGDIPVTGKPKFLQRTLVKTLVLWGMPAPKGKVPTMPEIDQQNAGTKPTTFDNDRKLLVALIQKFVGSSEHFKFQSHPFFGRMDKNEWGKLIYSHLDHHLRQFGA